MQTNLKTLGLSALISLLLILPFVIMEVVNRRSYSEDFPFMLFFGMWLNLFAFSLILLPVVPGMLKGNRNRASPVPPQENTLLTNPKPAAIISIILFMIPVLLFLIDTLGWVPLDRLINGPNPEQPYVPGTYITLGLISLPVASGVIARGLIVRTLQAGGSLFAYPLHLIIIVFLLSSFAIGFASFIIDQWPCFIGVPVCD